ncbi:MAG: hypothetical protein NVS3B27_15200 [Novosphingobium sp.]
MTAHLTLLLAYNAIVLATVALALRKGDEPEQLTSLVIVTALFADVINHWLLGAPNFFTINPGHLVLDGWELIVLMWVALYANRGWPLWVAALQMIVVAGHLSKLFRRLRNPPRILGHDRGTGLHPAGRGVDRAGFAHAPGRSDRTIRRLASALARATQGRGVPWQGACEPRSPGRGPDCGPSCRTPDRLLTSGRQPDRSFGPNSELPTGRSHFANILTENRAARPAAATCGDHA